VEVFARSAGSALVSLSPLARVRGWFSRISKKSKCALRNRRRLFDPALEGYVVYAVGSRGKRLRPLLALLAGGATGQINSNHVDLAVIVELIHIASLVHDDVMDEAERRRAQPTANARWGNSLSVLLGRLPLRACADVIDNSKNADIGRAIARTAATVCSGEMIQTQRRFDLTLTVDDYLRIVEMKTGSLFLSLQRSWLRSISEADPNVIEVFISTMRK